MRARAGAAVVLSRWAARDRCQAVAIGPKQLKVRVAMGERSRSRSPLGAGRHDDLVTLRLGKGTQPVTMARGALVASGDFFAGALRFADKDVIHIEGDLLLSEEETGLLGAYLRSGTLPFHNENDMNTLHGVGNRLLMTKLEEATTVRSKKCLNCSAFCTAYGAQSMLPAPASGVPCIFRKTDDYGRCVKCGNSLGCAPECGPREAASHVFKVTGAERLPPGYRWF